MARDLIEKAMDEKFMYIHNEDKLGYNFSWSKLEIVLLLPYTSDLDLYFQ